MINLLPTSTKQDMLFARKNSVLMSWVSRLAIGLVGTILVISFGDFYIHQQIKSYQKDIQVTEAQLKDQKLDETQAKITEMSGHIKLAVQILSRQVSFSDLLKQIGAAMPQGAALSALAITKLQGGIDLNIVAKDYKTASQAQVNLQDPKNGVFSSADIQNITCTTTKGTNSQYPCQVIVRVLFAANNPFLLVKKTGASQ